MVYSSCSVREIPALPNELNGVLTPALSWKKLGRPVVSSPSVRISYEVASLGLPFIRLFGLWCDLVSSLTSPVQRQVLLAPLLGPVHLLVIRLQPRSPGLQCFLPTALTCRHGWASPSPELLHLLLVHLLHSGEASLKLSPHSLTLRIPPKPGPTHPCDAVLALPDHVRPSPGWVKNLVSDVKNAFL